MLLDIVLKNLQSEGLLVDRRYTHLILAYSGGVDSTVMLHLLSKLRDTQNLTVTAAYYNHGWRTNAPEEFAVLHQNCQACHIPLVLIQADRTLAKTETVAREARYRELTRLSDDLNAHAVLTAHQADDQIETLLFHLFRGTGIEGLVGIQKNLELTAPSGKKVSVLRPMLDIFREGITRYAEANSLQFFEDPTNTNTKFHRNAIRREIMPLIQERFPHVKSAMLRLSDLAEGDLQIIGESMEDVWEKVYQPPTGNDSGKLNVIVFNQLARPYQRRVIKQYLVENEIQFDYQSIEEIVEFILGESRKKLSAGLKSLTCQTQDKNRFLSLYKNTVSIIQTEKPSNIVHSSETAMGTPLQVPGETFFDPLKLLFRASELSNDERKVPGLLRTRNSAEIYVNLSQYLDKPLVLRTRRPGDKIRPFGMPVAMRLKNYLINRGVPRFDREHLPLLACGQEVLWVLGVGISENLRVLDKPTHRLQMEKADHPPEVSQPEGDPTVSCPS